MPRRPPDPANIGRRGTRWRNAKAAAFRIWGTDCWWCHHPGGYEGDHLQRLTDGGDPYDPHNIRPAHGSNYPCPVCISPTTGRPRCCNQERNRRTKPARQPLTIDPRTL
jgi:hypothetical protein